MTSQFHVRGFARLFYAAILASATCWVSTGYAATGGFDAAFAGGGKSTTSIRTGGDMATAMLVQPDRKILVAGKSADGKGGNDLALMRYFADGILDTSFGDAGSKVIPLGAAVNRCNAAKRLALQADGKILVLTNIG